MLISPYSVGSTIATSSPYVRRHPTLSRVQSEPGRYGYMMNMSSREDSLASMEEEDETEEDFLASSVGSIGRLFVSFHDLVVGVNLNNVVNDRSDDLSERRLCDVKRSKCKKKNKV